STVQGTGRLVNRGTLELATNTVETPLHNVGQLTVHGGTATIEELTTETSPGEPRSTIEIGGGAGGNAELIVQSGFTNTGDMLLTSAHGAFAASLTVQGVLVDQSLIEV